MKYYSKNSKLFSTTYSVNEHIQYKDKKTGLMRYEEQIEEVKPTRLGSFLTRLIIILELLAIAVTAFVL